MDMRNIKAAIFDLDGTIADTMGIWDRIDDIFFEKNGITDPGDYKEAIKTMGFKDAACYTKKRFGLSQSCSEIIDDWYNMSKDEYAFNVKLKPYAAEFINKLSRKNIKIGLATATGTALFKPLLIRCGIYGKFDTFVTTDDAGKDKSCPDVYLLCAGKLAVPPEQCMVFEDTLAAVKSAKKAGMNVTGVFDAQSYAEKDRIMKSADYYINGFRDIIGSMVFNHGIPSK